MAVFDWSHLKKAKKGVELFNRRMFWECHEELEDHWLEDASDDARYVYWAIIQVATSLYHHRDGRIEGARGMLYKAKEKFDKCEKLGVESPLIYDFLNWEKLKATVRKIPEKPELDDFHELTLFRFKPDPSKWELK